MSHKYSFQNGEKLEAPYYLDGADGVRYDLVLVDESWMPSFIAVNPSGQICSKIILVGKPGGGSVGLSGAYEAGAGYAPLQRDSSTGTIAEADIRVIYNGAAAGSMSFQEIVVRRGQIVKSVAWSFDQFAKEVVIEGLAFSIKRATADSVELKPVFERQIALDVPSEYPYWAWFGLTPGLAN